MTNKEYFYKIGLPRIIIAIISLSIVVLTARFLGKLFEGLL